MRKSKKKFIDYVSEGFKLGWKHIDASLKKYVFTDTLHTKVVKNIHGDSSGVRGAAWLS